MDEKKLEDLARDGFNAYGDEAGWKTYDGKQMPCWDDVGPVIRGRWRAATLRILTRMGVVR
ncbi:hypothetical protein [Hyalangium sp.]|uniref:hypothetical protein n=1 Tax=Hyalangium sp. TaxID=2028555 RepID=UPI002D3CA653|nr:hypothetical protein [Hyalangium sp.]HYI00575.1 hypothetical protein [Hyalangium sp.]